MKRILSIVLFVMLLFTFFGCDTDKNVVLTEKDVYGDGYNANMIVGFDEQGHLIDAVSADREEKQVGIFYFLWLGYVQEDDIYDVSKIIKEHGKDTVFQKDVPGISPQLTAHWWGEPLYGYYNSADTWVIRKHMELLIDAGIDFLVFDATNAMPYVDTAIKVMQVVSELRNEGWNAPRVAFYTHTKSIQTINWVYNDIYKPGICKDAWYTINGKTMIIGYTDVSRDKKVSEDSSYNPQPLSDEVRQFFSFRYPRWPGETIDYKSWPYTEWQYPQPLNTDMVSVSIASHVMPPFSYSLTHEDWGNWGRGYNVKTGKNVAKDVLKGTFYASEWETAYELDPKYVFVTGWNEWVAWKQMYGGEYMLCDNVDMEYSRDAEPMKGGYEDAYFIQTVQSVRKFKNEGISGILPKTVRKTIDIDGSQSQWDDVNAVYRRAGTDNGERDSIGAAKTVSYKNDPVKNNILSVLVTNDAQNLYFNIECADNITLGGADNEMNIFIGKDRPNMKKGWEGYEYRLTVKGDGVMDVTKLKADFGGKIKGKAEYSINGNKMTVKLPRKLVKLSGDCDMYFKVADGVNDPFEIMDYYASGRSLPMGRLSYLYVLRDPT